MMPELLTDDELRQTALSLLESELGPLHVLRFLALVRREPFDYQAWRERSFDGLSIDELFHRMRESERSE